MPFEIRTIWPLFTIVLKYSNFLITVYVSHIFKLLQYYLFFYTTADDSTECEWGKQRAHPHISAASIVRDFNQTEWFHNSTIQPFEY